MDLTGKFPKFSERLESPKFATWISERKMCLPFAVFHQFQALLRFWCVTCYMRCSPSTWLLRVLHTKHINVQAKICFCNGIGLSPMTFPAGIKPAGANSYESAWKVFVLIRKWDLNSLIGNWIRRHHNLIKTNNSLLISFHEGYRGCYQVEFSTILITKKQILVNLSICNLVQYHHLLQPPS